jgi:hypothetical protein
MVKWANVISKRLLEIKGNKCIYLKVLMIKSDTYHDTWTNYLMEQDPDDVKGYRLIHPSTNQLIIECSVQFEESPLHAPPVQHAETLVLPSVPDIRDDDSTHSDATYSDTDSKDFVHADEQVVHPNEEPASELQQMPKWAQSTLQAAGNLAGDPLDSRRTRSQHVDNHAGGA